MITVRGETWGEYIKRANPGWALLHHPGMPTKHVVRDPAGGHWLLSQLPDAWQSREPYTGPTAHLTPVRLEYAYLLGIPLHADTV